MKASTEGKSEGSEREGLPSSAVCQAGARLPVPLVVRRLPHPYQRIPILGPHPLDFPLFGSSFGMEEGALSSEQDLLPRFRDEDQQAMDLLADRCGSGRLVDASD